MFSFFGKAWAGEESLAKAFWLIYVVLGMILGLISGIILLKFFGA